MCSVTEDAEQTEDLGTCQLGVAVGVGRALGVTADVAPEAAETRACPEVGLEAAHRMLEAQPEVVVPASKTKRKGKQVVAARQASIAEKGNNQRYLFIVHINSYFV